jgi:L-ribulokinase
MMQIYADIIGRPMKVSRSDQTPALGAGIFAAVAAGKDAGGYNSVEDAEAVMAAQTNEYVPIKEHHETYRNLYALYRQLHDGYGTLEWSGGMFNVMKDLLAIRDSVRRTVARKTGARRTK